MVTKSSMGLMGPVALLATIACTGNVGSTATDPSCADGAPSCAGAGAGASQGTSGSTGAGASATAGGSGSVGGGGGSGSSGPPPPVDWQAECQDAATDSGASVLRRLSALEYQLAVKAILQLPALPDASKLPADAEHDGFRTYAEYQTMSAENLRGYLATATALADALMADAARRTTVFGCDTAATGCLASAVTKLGALAFRRQLEAKEVDGIVKAAEENALDVPDRFRYAVEALLTSPSFLYRVEIGDKKEGLSALSSYEVASRLSFALWGQGPSEQLLSDAKSGKLDTPEGLQTVARTMLEDERTPAFYGAFFQQWLGYQNLNTKDTAVASRFSAMRTETDLLVKDFAWGKGSVLGALTANYTYVTPDLATFYGLPAPGEGGRVEFPAGHVRASSGLLTHGSVLTAKRDGDLIAMRGNWVRATFLCKHLTVPAALADTIGDVLVGLDRVGIVKARNSRAECSGCHKLIDPIGIAFAQFDRVGAYDADEDISAFGLSPGLADAPDSEFASLDELSAKLASLPGVSQCLTQRAFLYVNGRDPSAPDSCSIKGSSRTFEDSGQSFRGLLAALVESPSFRVRRAPAP